MSLLKLIIVVFGLVNVGNMAFAQTLRTYKLTNYPVEAEDCEDEAATWGQRLATTFGVSIFQTECLESTTYEREGFDLIISFSSANPLPRETKVQDLLYGSYGDPDDCNDDLDDQINLFQTQTGLTAFAAYCSPVGYLFLRAFGESDVTRRLFKSHLGGEYRVGEVWVEDPDAAKTQLHDAITDLGAVVANLQLRMGRVYIYYYAREKLNLQATQFTSYADENDCESGKSRVAQTITTFQGNSIFQLCASTDRYPVPQKSMFTLIAMPYPFFWPQIYQLYLEDVAGSYDDLDRCLGDISRVERFYEQNLGREVYGSVCSYRHEEPRRYKIKIFRSVQ